MKRYRPENAGPLSDTTSVNAARQRREKWPPYAHWFLKSAAAVFSNARREKYPEAKGRRRVAVGLGAESISGRSAGVTPLENTRPAVQGAPPAARENALAARE